MRFTPSEADDRLRARRRARRGAAWSRRATSRSVDAARRQLSEVKLGIIPAMISPYVIAAIGSRMARRYMLSGEEFDCAEAYRIGLLHDISEEDDLIGRIGTMLGHLYTSGPNALAAVKQLIPLSAHAEIGPGLIEETSRRIARLRATPEAQEGFSAFLEKRKAHWMAPPVNATKGKSPAKKNRGANKRSAK